MANRIELIMELKSVELARALCHSVEPDNRTAPEGVTVITSQEGKRLISTIKSKKRLQTLLATFNDLVTTLTTVLRVLERL